MKMAVDRTRERGESKGFSGILSLAALAAFGMALWNVAPPYMSDYTLGDSMRELCRLNRALNPDDEIREKLMKIVREEKLDAYINKPMFIITTRDTSRRIQLEYQREIQILPGWKRIFKYSHDLDQPYF
jgi:hypothetical protein